MSREKEAGVLRGYRLKIASILWRISRYFSRVLSTISSGRGGGGEFLSHVVVSR